MPVERVVTSAAWLRDGLIRVKCQAWTNARSGSSEDSFYVDRANFFRGPRG
jgi:hypothetical protein